MLSNETKQVFFACLAILILVVIVFVFVFSDSYTFLKLFGLLIAFAGSLATSMYYAGQPDLD